MQTIYVFLAKQNRLHGDLLDSLLHREHGVKVVARVDSEMALARALSEFLDGSCDVDDPVFAISSIAETDRIPAEVSRLLSEFPELTIVGICWTTGKVRSFQLRIDVQNVHSSLAGLLAVMRDCGENPKSY